jgi:hypothetical protein
MLHRAALGSVSHSPPLQSAVMTDIELSLELHDAVCAIFPPNVQRWLKELQQQSALLHFRRKRIPLEVVRRHLLADPSDDALRERVWRSASTSECLTLLHAMLRGLWGLAVFPEDRLRLLCADPSARAVALLGIETFDTFPPRRSAMVIDEFPYNDGRLIPGPAIKRGKLEAAHG